MRFLTRRRLGPAVLGIVAAATAVAAAVPAGLLTPLAIAG